MSDVGEALKKDKRTDFQKHDANAVLELHDKRMRELDFDKQIPDSAGNGIQLDMAFPEEMLGGIGESHTREPHEPDWPDPEEWPEVEGGKFDLDDVLEMNENRDWVKKPLQVLSYGAGTQSSAMLILISKGLLPTPDIVIFGDTGSETPDTWELINTTARPFIEDVIGIPFFIVRSHRGALHDYYMRRGTIPMIGFRSCTNDFKILPQRRLIRKIVGNQNGNIIAECWLGITTDEIQRRKDIQDVSWTRCTYPLLDIYPMSRTDCIRMDYEAGWEVAKSGCFCCPYRGFKSYMALKKQFPDLVQVAADMENTILAKKKAEGKNWNVGLMHGGFVKDILDIDFEQPNFGEWFEHEGMRWEDSQCDSDAGCFI